MALARTLAVAQLGVVEYGAGLALQDALVAARIANEIGDTMLLLEHPHVYTLGRGADARFILENRAGVPVYRVSRGGQVTYHGPGQLIAYPILRLEGARRDVTRYLRDLEQSIIGALAMLGVEAGRRDGLTGVWSGDEKIASIGVGIRRWVTYHGLALNVATDLTMFGAIVPCGIDGCRMTSVARCGGSGLTMRDAASALASSFADVFGYERVETADAASILSLAPARESPAEARS